KTEKQSRRRARKRACRDCSADVGHANLARLLTTQAIHAHGAPSRSTRSVFDSQELYMKPHRPYWLYPVQDGGLHHAGLGLRRQVMDQSRTALIGDDIAK